MESNSNMDVLFSEAWKVRDSAHVPYSGFKVGAILTTREGKNYKGCNIETSVASLSLCAERVALVNALANGERDFVRMIIIAESGQPLLPCGVCRQMLSEFAPNLLITSLNHKGDQITISLEELFPSRPVHET